MITLSGITVAGAGGRPLLHRIDLRIAAGELVGIVGPNGAGKSTLARVLAGVQAASAGTVRRDGDAPAGLVLQDPAAQLVAATVAEDVAFGPECDQVAPAAIGQLVAAQLHAAGLELVAWHDPQVLSGGEQQRTAIAGQLARRCGLLVLDEPTAHLDVDAAGRVQRAVAGLARAGMAVAWVTQRLEELVASTRVVVVDAGAIAWDGSPRELLSDPVACGSLGLGVAGPVRIAARLRERGVPLPRGIVAEGELVASLGGRR